VTVVAVAALPRQANPADVEARAAPAALRGEAARNGTVTLRWAEMAEAAAYRVYSDMGSGYDVYIYQAAVADPQYSEYAPIPGATYRYRITAYQDGVESLPARVAVTTQGAASPPLVASRGPAGGSAVAVPVVTPAPTTVPPDTIILGVVSSEQYVDDLGSVTVAGEVRNDSALNVGNGKIAVTFYDAAGQVLAQDEVSTLLDILSPGQRSPFVLTRPRPPGLADYSLRATARPTTQEPRSRLAVLSSRSFERGGFYHVAGQVENRGTRSVGRVEVMVTLYSLTGKVVNVGVAWGKPQKNMDKLAPGERADFDCVFTYYPWVSYHKVQAEGE
jgi:hypothetical protein